MCVILYMDRNMERSTVGRGFRGGGGGGVGGSGRGEGPPSFRGGPAGPGRGSRGTGGRMDHRGRLGGGGPPISLGRGDVISVARGNFYGGSGRGIAGRDGPSRGRGTFRGGRGRGRGRGRITTMHSEDDVSTTYGNLLHTSSGDHQMDMIDNVDRMSRPGTYESMAQEEARLDPYPPPPPPLPPSGPSDVTIHQPPLPPPEEQPPIPLYANNYMNNDAMGHYEDVSLHSGGSNIHSIGSNHAGPIPQSISPPKRFSSGSPGRGTFGRGRGNRVARGRGDGGRGIQRVFHANEYIPDHAPAMGNYNMGMELNDTSEEFKSRPISSFTGGRDGGFSGPGRNTFGRDGPRTFGRGRGFRGGGRDGGRFLDQSGRGGQDGTPRIGGRIPGRGRGRGFRTGDRDGIMGHYGREERRMDEPSQTDYNTFGDNRSVLSNGGGGYASLASEESNIGQYHSTKQPQLESYYQGSISHQEKRNIRAQPTMNSDDSYRNGYTPSKAKPPSFKSMSKATSREHIDPAPPSPKPQEPVHVVPPSPPAAPPSNLAAEIARLTDLTAQMEFQYAKHLQCSIDHEIIKTKIATLKELPVGIDAFREDLDRLNSDLSSKDTS